MFSVCLSLSLYVCVSLSLTLSVSLTVCLSLSVYFRLNFFNLQILNCDRINHYADNNVKCLTNIKLHIFVKIFFFSVFGQLLGRLWAYWAKTTASDWILSISVIWNDIQGQSWCILKLGWVMFGRPNIGSYFRVFEGCKIINKKILPYVFPIYNSKLHDICSTWNVVHPPFN